MRNEIDPIHFELLVGIGVALNTKTIGRIGKVERAVGLVDDVIGAVERFALIGVGEDGELGFWIQGAEAVDVALSMACDAKAAANIEGHAIRSRLRSAVGRGAPVAAGLKKDADALIGRPFANAVAGNLGEEKAVSYPDGAFDPLESSGDALKGSVGGDDVVDGGVEAVYLEWSRLELTRVEYRRLGRNRGIDRGDMPEVSD